MKVQNGMSVIGVTFYGTDVKGTVASYETLNGKVTKLFAVTAEGSWYRLKEYKLI